MPLIYITNISGITFAPSLTNISNFIFPGLIAMECNSARIVGRDFEKDNYHCCISIRSRHRQRWYVCIPGELYC